jgi:7,8-dihydroneopterin aldolase/epimerase/oxygenase
MALIRLEGLSLFGHHGATAAERRVGTRLGVDVVVEVDSARAEMSDRLADTVSYDVIEAAVRRVVEDESYRLLEALAARVADECLERFPLRSSTVRLTKQNLAWPTGGRVSVEVTHVAAAGGTRKARGRKSGKQ